LQLTPTGDMLRKYAEQALGGLRLLHHDIAALKGSLSGDLALGATFILSDVLPAVSSRFRAQFPGVVLQVRIDIPETLFAHLRMGTLDIACYVHVRTPPGLAVEPVGTEEFVIIASPRHPLAARGHVRPEDLKDLPVVVSRNGLLRESLEAKLRAVGVVPGQVTEARNYDAVKTLVAQDVGFSIHVRRLIAAELATGQLVILNLDGPPITTEIVVAYRSQPVVPALIRELVPFIREELLAKRLIATIGGRTGRRSSAAGPQTRS
jgi:DNA-binding transcriptional LysR family regulator